MVHGWSAEVLETLGHGTRRRRKNRSFDGVDAGLNEAA